jgi:uncharacterized protein
MTAAAIPSRTPQSTVKLLVDGPVGVMEVLLDSPLDSPRGIAIVTHPQPLLGGSSMHKVPHTLARALRDAGWLVARPNFRGVGATAGEHDHGVGETEDVLALAAHLRALHPSLALALIGFSFGAYVQSRVARVLADGGNEAVRLLLAGLPNGEVEGQRRYAPETNLPHALVVHGEYDERVALSAVLDWARPQAQPVVVIPGADHAFTGCLPALRELMLKHLESSEHRPHE